MSQGLPEPNTIKSCSCGECFYCFINQDTAHSYSLNKLSSQELSINVAEYVGPEMAMSKAGKKNSPLSEIRIELCTSGYNE